MRRTGYNRFRLTIRSAETQVVTADENSYRLQSLLDEGMINTTPRSRSQLCALMPQLDSDNPSQAAGPRKVSFALAPNEIGLLIVLFTLLALGSVVRLQHAKPFAQADSVVAQNHAWQVDPNSAGIYELMLLPNIGEVRAAAIVTERERNGPFNSLDDLMRVHGIGPKTIDHLSNLVTLELREPPQPIFSNVAKVE